MAQINVEHSHSVQRDARCSKCRWWREVEPILEYENGAWRPKGHIGECRRNAPNPKWPRVTDKDFCGQYVWEYA